jgi:hypothetical protein
MSRKQTSDVLTRARAFIEASRWQAARTQPWLPHEYTLRSWHREAGTEPDFLAMVKLIRGRHGYIERFGSKRLLTYLKVDDHRYWLMSAPHVPIADVLAMTTLINRCEVGEDGRPLKGPRWLREGVQAPKPIEDNAAQMRLEVGR